MSGTRQRRRVRAAARAGDPAVPLGAAPPAPRPKPAPATPAAPRAPDAEPPLTALRFAGALVLACPLLFVMLLVFAFAGLGSLGIVPAVVVSTVLTGRIAKVRRRGVLVAVGVLSLMIVVGISFGIAMAVYVADHPTGT